MNLLVGLVGVQDRMHLRLEHLEVHVQTARA
jgi:hypothetical protein